MGLSVGISQHWDIDGLGVNATAELTNLRNAEGGSDDISYTTIGLEISRGPWSVASTYSKRNADSTSIDQLIQLSAGYALTQLQNQLVVVSGGYKLVEVANVTEHVIGLQVSWTFSTSST